MYYFTKSSDIFKCIYSSTEVFGHMHGHKEAYRLAPVDRQLYYICSPLC